MGSEHDVAYSIKIILNVIQQNPYMNDCDVVAHSDRHFLNAMTNSQSMRFFVLFFCDGMLGYTLFFKKP